MDEVNKTVIASEFKGAGTSFYDNHDNTAGSGSARQ
jgi:hypothetical protein